MSPTDPPTDRPADAPSTVRRIAVVVAVAVPIVPIVIGLLLGTGARRSAVPSAAAPSAAASSASASSSAAPSASAAATSTAAFATGAGHRARVARASPAPPGRGAIVGVVGHAVALRASPGGRPVATLATRTPFRSPTFVLVARRRGGWLGVVTTLAGNNRIGWIPASAVALGRVDWSLHAFLARHQLVVYHAGRAVRRFTVAVGAPASPTPTGRYEVTDRLRTGDPGGPYGCCILALSATAPHGISGWNGGNRIAIHSTPDTSTIGESVSHGCLHVTLAEGRWLIAHVPLGTPTIISSA